MQPYMTDNSAEAEAIQLELFRRMSLSDRIAKICNHSTGLRCMDFDSVRRFRLELGEVEVKLKFIESTKGKKLAGEMQADLRQREVSESKHDDLVSAAFVYCSGQS